MKFRAATLLYIAPLVLLHAWSASAQVQSTVGGIGREPMTLQHPPPAGTSLPSTAAGGGYGAGYNNGGSTTISAQSDGKGGAIMETVARVPLVFDVNALVGYDSNTLASPNNEQDSVFFNTSLDISYTAQNPRASLLLFSEVGVSYYIDRPGRDYDLNVALNGRFSYKLNARAEFDIDAINVYQPEPEFSVVGSQDRRTSDYFYLSDRFGLSYRWAPRFSTITSYTPGAFIYRQDPSSTAENRFENLFSQEFRFLLRPTLTVLAEYRFNYIDYFYVNGDSYSNFVLGGVESQLSPRLSAGVRAGAEFREFIDAGELTEPIVEGRLSYSLTSLSSLTLNVRYGIEQGDLVAANSTRNTFRIGLSYGQQVGRRLSVSGSAYYTHSNYNDNNNNLVAAGPGGVPVVANASFEEETVDLAFGARFALNRRLSFQTGYTYSLTNSDVALREYDRHRVFAGVRLTF